MTIPSSLTLPAPAQADTSGEWSIVSQQSRILPAAGHAVLMLRGPHLVATDTFRSEQEQLAAKFLDSPEVATMRRKEKRRDDLDANIRAAEKAFNAAELAFRTGDEDENIDARAEMDFICRREELATLRSNRPLIAEEAGNSRHAAEQLWHTEVNATRERIAAAARLEYGEAMAELSRVVAPVLSKLQIAAMRKVPSFPSAADVLNAAGVPVC